jgi:hypothetical protein
MCRLLFLILLFSLQAFGQQNCIIVKLSVTHGEDYTYTYENARLILTGNGRDDTLRPNRELEFVLEGLKEGDYSFYITPQNQLHSNRITQYRFCYDPKTIIGNTMEISFSPFCHYSKENKTCPVCCTDDKVVPIVYGLIASINKVDENGNIIENKKNYKAGGCVVSGCDPHWYCEQDDVEF